MFSLCKLQVVWPLIVYGVLGLGLMVSCMPVKHSTDGAMSPVPVPFYIARLCFWVPSHSHVQRSEDDLQEIKFRLPGLTVSTFAHWATVMVSPASYFYRPVAMWPGPSWNSLSSVSASQDYILILAILSQIFCAFWMWWHMPLVAALRRQMQVICEFEVNLVT